MADLSSFGSSSPDPWEKLKNLARGAINMAAQNPQPPSLYGNDAAMPPAPPIVETGPYADMMAMQAAGEQDYLSNTAPISYNPPEPQYGPPVSLSSPELAAPESFRPAPEGMIPPVNFEAGAVPQWPNLPIVGDVAGTLASGAGDFYDILKQSAVQPTVGASPVGMPDVRLQGATPAQTYQALDYPSNMANQTIQEAVPGAPGRVLGSAADFVLQPENAIGGLIGGGGKIANLLGRGTLGYGPYFGSLAGAGAASQAAEELGGSTAVQAAAGLTGSIGGLVAPAVGTALARGATSYADNLARMGAEAVPEGAVTRTIAPATDWLIPEQGVARQLSPTEGFNFPPVAGGAPTPDEIVRRQVDELVKQGYTPEEAQQFLQGMYVKTGEQIAAEQAAQREFFANRPPAEPPPPPPPVEPPTGGLPGEPGGFSGRPISYAGAQFAPTQPLIPETEGPLFNAAPTAGTTPATAPLSEDILRQRQAIATNTVAQNVPPEMQGDVRNFVDTRRAVLESLPDQRSFAGRRGAAFSGNLQNPFLDELTASEAELRTLVLRGLKDADPEAAQSTVNATQQALRKQMLDERYGSYPSQARLDAEEVLREADRVRMAGGSFVQTYDAIGDTLREMVLGLDVVAATGQQGLRVARHSPGFVAGVVNTMLNKAGIGFSLYEGGIDHVSQAIADGLQMGAKGTTAGIEKSLIGRIPKVGGAIEELTTAQFSHGLSTARLKTYEGMLLINKALHSLSGGLVGGDITDPLVRRHIAEYANTAGSAARSATGARRAALERRALLSAPMTRAAFSEVLTPLKSLRSQEDMLNTLNMVAGTAILFAGANEVAKEIGAPHFTLSTDPLHPDFGRIVTRFKDSQGDYIKVDFLPQSSVFRTGLKLADALISADPKAAGDALARYVAGRANVIPSDAAKVGGFGYDAEGQMHYGSMSLRDRGIGVLPVPLAYQNVAGGETSLPGIISGQAGLTAYGETPFNTFERVFKAKTGIDPTELLPSEVDSRVEGDPEIAAEKQRYEDRREGRLAEITRDKYKALSDKAPLLEINPRDYREAVGDVVRDAAIRFDEAKRNGEIPDFDKQSGIRGVLAGYYDAIKPARSGDEIGSTVDYDLQEKLGTEYLDKLDPDTRERIISELSYSKDPTYRGLLEARSRLKDYFNAPDDAVGLVKQIAEQLPEGDPRRLIAKFDDYGDFRSTMREAFKQAGVPETEIDSRVDVVADRLGLSKLVDATRKLALTKDPAAILDLEKYYGAPKGMREFVAELAASGVQ